MAYDHFKQFHNIAALVERPHVRIDYFYFMSPVEIRAEQLLVGDSALVLAQRKVSRLRNGSRICGRFGRGRARSWIGRGGGLRPFGSPNLVIRHGLIRYR